jgi:hypothetical protein
MEKTLKLKEKCKNHFSLMSQVNASAKPRLFGRNPDSAHLRLGNGRCGLHGLRRNKLNTQVSGTAGA